VDLPSYPVYDAPVLIQCSYSFFSSQAGAVCCKPKKTSHWLDIP